MRSSWCPHGNQALWVREDMPLFLPVANFLLPSDPAQVGTQLCTHSSSAQTPVRTILPLRINECGPRKVGFGGVPQELLFSPEFLMKARVLVGG